MPLPGLARAVALRVSFQSHWVSVGVWWGRAPVPLGSCPSMQLGLGYLWVPPLGLLPPTQGLEKKSIWLTQASSTASSKTQTEHHNVCMHCVLIYGDGGAITSQPLSSRRLFCSTLGAEGSWGQWPAACWRAAWGCPQVPLGVAPISVGSGAILELVGWHRKGRVRSP